MFILQALESKKEIKKSLNGVLSFIDELTKEEKKVEEYFERKLKDLTYLYVIGFKSLSPLKLQVKEKYEIEKMPLELKMEKEIFYPILFSYNITNHQYKKIEGIKDGYSFKAESAGSFSDYYLSRKVFNNLLPSLIELKTNEKFEKKPKKDAIMIEFYKKVNEIFLNTYEKIKNKDIEKFNYELFLDFNSILDIKEAAEDEKEKFVLNLLNEYEIIHGLSIREILQQRSINQIVYLLESIEFQLKEIYKVKQVTNKTIEEIFNLSIKLPFEVPTAEKPMLSNKRVFSTKKNGDIPNVTFLEIFLLRFLVLNINKQGSVEGSGFLFHLKEGVTSATSIEKSMQITGDAYGNMSIVKIDLKDRKKREFFEQRIINNYQLFFNKQLNKKDSMNLFWAKYVSVKEIFFKAREKEREVMDVKMGKHLYREVAKILTDIVYKNISKRILSFETKTEDTIWYFHLIDLLFVLYSLDNKKIERLSFLTNKLNTNELLKKDRLENEELCFLLGAVVGITIRMAKDRDSIKKRCLKLINGKEIVDIITKRIVSSYEEIDEIEKLTEVMNILAVHLKQVNDEFLLTTEGRFAYVAGLLFESKIRKKEEQVVGG